MLRHFVIVAIWVGVASASPIPDLPQLGQPRSLAPQQFLVLHPQFVAPQLKYEQPIIAPITPLGHISTSKEQLYFFYPSSPVVSFQRDDGEDFNLINFITNWFAAKPAETTAPVAVAPAAPEVPAAPASAPEVIQPAGVELSVGEELRPGLFPDGTPPRPAQQPRPETLELSHPDAELIPQQPQPQPARPQLPPPQQPAFAPFPLIPQIPDRRVYILSGQPQFFGNFDAFSNPLNPIYSLQPLTAIIPRSKEGDEVAAAAGEEEVAANSVAPEEEVVAMPVAELKQYSEVVAVEEATGPIVQQEPEQQQQQQDGEVDAPVDAIARSNSRVEPITADVRFAAAAESQQEATAEEVKAPTNEGERRVEEEMVVAIQGKSAGGKCTESRE